MASQSALIKDTFYCRCAKEFEVKSSAKIKKKKRKECETATDRNCNSTVNQGFQEDDEIQPNTKNRSSLTPLMEIDDLQSNSCRGSTKKETDAEVTKSKKFKRGNFHSTGQGKSCVVEVREEQMIQQNSSCLNEDPRTRKVSLVSSMIYDLQRKDTFTETTETSTFQRRGTSQQWDKSRLERQVTSTNVSVSVFQSKFKEGKISYGQDKVRKMGLDTMKRNCDLLLTGIGDTRNAKAKQTDSVAQNKFKDKSKCSDDDPKIDINGVTADDGSVQHSKKSKLIQEMDTETGTTCCFQWLPSLSHNKLKKSTEAEDLSELEKNERRETTKDETGEHIQNGEKEKVSLLSRLKSKLTKRKILAVMCPCFTYLILKGESKEKVANDEMRQDDMHRQVMR